MAVDKPVPESGDNEPIIYTTPLSSRANGVHDKNRMSGSNLREQYLSSNLAMLQSPPEPHQLPSPEATPSPRSSSPSSIVMELSPVGRSDTIISENGRSSASFGHFHQDQDGDTPGASISPPRPISKSLPAHQLHLIPEENTRRVRRPSHILSKSATDDKILKLSPSQIEELTEAPDSLPIPQKPRASPSNLTGQSTPTSSNGFRDRSSGSVVVKVGRGIPMGNISSRGERPSLGSRSSSTPNGSRLEVSVEHSTPKRSSPSLSFPHRFADGEGDLRKPGFQSEANGPILTPTSSTPTAAATPSTIHTAENPSSPIPQDIPLPPMSIPTYLQLELASSRPSPLYIHRSAASEYPFESSKIKFERLLNFLLLPPQLEHVLGFGSFACLDAWLYTFTILPLRFMKAVAILVQWWGLVLGSEARFISDFIYHGAGRMWHRRRGRSNSTEDTPSSRSASRQARTPPSVTSSRQSRRLLDGKIVNGPADTTRVGMEQKLNLSWGRSHKRKISQPSNLSSYHKADLLQGSVGDRLLAALGQDIFECLFCEETIERGPDGRSKLLRPFGMFVLALIYNVIHAVTLFLQVITLNVAVNSYSNAFLSLLMSNMFVEIKSTVFKKFEKENIFQLTCADIVERFQLWLMLVIIGLRNVVEVGGLSVNSGASAASNVTGNNTIGFRSNFIPPMSFTILPNWTGEVLSPFLLVLGSEMIVDWLKHAYIGKFNNVKPALYQKFLDVLAKDYYANAFINQNLTKRLGLPVIPLSCLFIRAVVQTYHMFLATHLPAPIPSTATELALESDASASPATTAALEHIDAIIKRALGRSTFGSGADAAAKSWFMIGTDDIIAFLAMSLFFLCAFLVLLACKLVLGMILLSYARHRYSSMKDREHLSVDTKGKRLGGWGMVEVDDDKRRWIYEDDPEGAKALEERERKVTEKTRQGNKGVDFARVTRYEMSAKRIW